MPPTKDKFWILNKWSDSIVGDTDGYCSAGELTEGVEEYLEGEDMAPEEFERNHLIIKGLIVEVEVEKKYKVTLN